MYRHLKFNTIDNDDFNQLAGTSIIDSDFLSDTQHYWVLYHVKSLGHDTSVRQHYKSEH